jgi:hypothetical protein
MNKEFNRDNVLDILEWIKLGHYKLREEDILKLISFYNDNVPLEDQIIELDALKHDLKMQVVRMTEHLTHIKQEALIPYEQEELFIAAEAVA